MFELFFTRFTPNLVDEGLSEFHTLLFISIQIRAIYDVMEKNAYEERDLIDNSEFAITHFGSVLQFSKNFSNMMIGVKMSPILTIIFSYNIPPFFFNQMMILMTGSQFNIF